MPRSAMLVAVFLFLSLGAALASAQIPDKFTNLKVFPADTPKRELVDRMREFTGALGVRCNHCHVGQDPNSLEGYDVASDDKETKRVARAMLQMAREINSHLLPTTGRQSPMEVRCVTCHRGVTKPQTLDQLLTAEIAKGGVPAATARYRELRQQYYGSGSYDFGPRALNSVAENLARGQNNVDGAIEVAKLNVEFNGDKGESHLGLAGLYATKGDKDAAIACIERALAINPEDGRAKQMLERVRSGK